MNTINLPMESPALQSDILVEQLRRLIVTGAVPTGNLVTERQLLAMLDGGRTPLRDALRVLAQEHLVRVYPRRGILIPNLTPEDFSHIHDATTWVGEYSVAQAAERITPEEIAGVEDVLAQGWEHAERNEWFELAEADADFHGAISGACGNPYLADIARSLHTAEIRFTYAGYQDLPTAEIQHTEHETILDALTRHHTDDAVQSYRSHMQNATRRLLDALERRLTKDRTRPAL
jgi:DNA-binding GntR family transcriptional regulator